MRKLFMESRLVMFGQLVLGIDERRPYLAPGQVSFQFLTASHKRKIEFALDEIRLGKHDALLNYACIDSFSVLHDRELTGQLYGYDPDGDPITAQLNLRPNQRHTNIPSRRHLYLYTEHALPSAPTVSPIPGRMA
jgi:hypothetical protein